MFRVISVVACAFICLNQSIGTAEGQIRFVDRSFMGDLGHASLDRQGNPIVAMNPRLCARLGPELCSFFRTHEIGHHQLRHFYRNISTQQAEAEADRYAAMHSSPQAVQAARRYFAAGGGATRVHGSSIDRLARVSGKNIGYSPKRSAKSRSPRSYSSGTRVLTKGNRTYYLQTKPKTRRVIYVIPHKRNYKRQTRPSAVQPVRTYRPTKRLVYSRGG